MIFKKLFTLRESPMSKEFFFGKNAAAFSVRFYGTSKRTHKQKRGEPATAESEARFWERFIMSMAANTMAWLIKV